MLKTGKSNICLKSYTVTNEHCLFVLHQPLTEFSKPGVTTGTRTSACLTCVNYLVWVFPLLKYFIHISPSTFCLFLNRPQDSGSEEWSSSSRVDTHLLGNNVSFPNMNVDGVHRGWQEQVLPLAVKRLSLGRIRQLIRRHFRRVLPQKPST